MIITEMCRGLAVDGRGFPWKTSEPVHSVDNFVGFCTREPLENSAAGRLIHRVPRSMKKRME